MADTAPYVVTLELQNPGAAATTDLNLVVGEAPFAGTVTAVTFTPDTAITGANTDTRSLNVINAGSDGTGTTEIASIDFVSGTDADAFDETALTLSAVEDATTVAAGDIIKLNSDAIGGSGMVDPGGLLQVTISRS